MRMDACLDTLSDKLHQVNTHVGCIARRQAAIGGFMLIPLHLHQLQRMRVMMALVVMMLMRTMMLTRPVMMICLLDVLTLCHS